MLNYLREKFRKKILPKYQWKKFEEQEKVKENEFTVGLLFIATNQYINFLPQVIASADENFFLYSNVNYYIFTNKDFSISSKRKITKIDIPHEPWPFVTLKRFHYFYDSKELFQQEDYLFYSDVDMRFFDKVGNEMLPVGSKKITATIHPSFYYKEGTYETNPASKAFVKKRNRKYYFCGGISGGKKEDYLSMSKEIKERIDADLQKDIIAIWHDESHLNGYLADKLDQVHVLPPAYCYPESWNMPWPKKILALDKDHKAIRNETNLNP